jgi:hypothetical protein
MISNRQHLSPSIVLSTLVALVILMSFNSIVRAQEKSVVGAWWGRAIPNCQGQGRSDCPPEVVMMPMIHPPNDPTILRGLVTVTDSGLVPAHSTGLVGPHTTGVGVWFQKDKDDGVCPRGTVRFEATFGWLQGADPTITDCPFQGTVITRFVTCFDKTHPDQMKGILTPYFYNHVNLDTCQSNLDSDGLPVPNPRLSRLPETCNGLDEETGAFCPFTAFFTINRVTDQPN